jgi:predicted CXXCH cytochrome family protein
MPRYKLVFALCALSLILIAASIPLKTSTAAETTGPASGIRLLVPESLSFAVSGPQQSGNKRGKMSYQPANTSEKKITVVGVAEGGIQPEMEVVNNGQPEITPVFHKQYFHAQVPLALGMNEIEVRWRLKGAGGQAEEWNVDTIPIFRYSKDQGPPNSNYSTYLFHTPEKEKQCRQCHQMTLTPEELDSGTDNSCLACHADLLKSVHVHGPVNVVMCASCHNPKSKPNRYRIDKDDNVLCYSCHDDRKETDAKKKLMHGPVAAGLCMVCHDPHGSPYDYQLVKPMNELCVMCHQEDAERWLSMAHLHPPFKKGECYRCHDPHSSDYQYNLKANEKDLCKLCHRIPVPGHWHDNWPKTPLFDLPEDLPLDDEGKIMCLTCHDPHGAEGPYLTRRGGGCRSCHAI